MRNPILIQDRRARWVIYAVACILLVTLFANRSIPVSRDNGFDLTDTLVPRDLIYHGGPGRDGIPAIDRPRFVSVDGVDFLDPGDRILGLAYEGVERAYPIKILNYHEIVNDTVNQQSVVISYCPLCGSGVAFKPDAGNQRETFGVSGLLYYIVMLLYDRATESLWSQIMGVAISGQLKGKKLATLAVENTSWSDWLKRHPGTQVLSTRTGYFRDYDRHPYGDYDVNQALYFPVRNTSARYHPKERVIGVVINGQAKAYPVSELAAQGRTRFTDKLGEKEIIIEYNPEHQSAVVLNERGQSLVSTTLFWFAWLAFHPDTAVFSAKTQPGD